MSKTTFKVNRSELKVVMSRTFHASPARVFEVVVDPKSVPHWWGPRGFEIVVDKMDVRKGGLWRYIVLDLEKHQHAFNGMYREVSAPNRLSYTFKVEGLPDDLESVETSIFEGVGDETRMTTTVEYRRLDNLEQVVSSGMEERVKESWDRLAELVES